MTAGKIYIFVFIILAFVYGTYAQEKTAVNPESGKEYNTGLKLYSEGKFAPALEHFTKAGQLDAGNM
ncbi:MAG: hypothetical protein ACYC9O_18100, partial [Candidatus Latescibacterota bacterium]